MIFETRDLSIFPRSSTTFQRLLLYHMLLNLGVTDMPSTEHPDSSRKCRVQDFLSRHRTGRTARVVNQPTILAVFHGLSEERGPGS
jgi:hypothetical protein